MSKSSQVHTLGTLIEPIYKIRGTVPAPLLQNYNIQTQGVEQQARDLGFDAPLFKSTAEEYLEQARKKGITHMQKAKLQGVPNNAYYNLYKNTNSGPTNYNWSTTPMKNLQESTSTIPFKYAESWPLTDKETRSDYRTSMGQKMIDANSKLRQVRLY